MARRFPVRAAKAGLGIKAALTIFVLVYATGFAIMPKQFSAEKGSRLSVTNNLLSLDKGFSKALVPLSATGTCPSNNVTFAVSANNANTVVTLGDIVFDAQVNATGTTPTLSCFTVTLTLTPSGGSPPPYTVTIASGSSVSQGWTIDCKFDVGASLPASPFSFKITVQ